MPKKLEEEPIPDADSLEWTKEKFAKSMRFHQLPENLQQILSSRKRGPQKAPTKILISVRLSPDVLDALRASGKGWQTKVDDVLRSQLLNKKTKRG